MKYLFLAFSLATLAFSAALGAAAVAQAQIVAIGDSNIAGKGVASSDNYPTKLEKALRARGYKGAVTNAGISGDTTQGVLARLDSMSRRERRLPSCGSASTIFDGTVLRSRRREQTNRRSSTGCAPAASKSCCSVAIIVRPIVPNSCRTIATSISMRAVTITWSRARCHKSKLRWGSGKRH